MNVRFEASDVRFAEHEQRSAAKVLGRISGAGEPFEISVWLSQGDNGLWTSFLVQGWKLTGAEPQVRAMLTKIAEFSAGLLTQLALHMQRNPDGSGAILFGAAAVRDEADLKSYGVHRPRLRPLPVHKWEDLWDRIHERIEHDRSFHVIGFDRQEIRTAVTELRKFFPAGWVRNKCREAGALHLGSEMAPSSPQWFPCYHLARTAHGSLCVDIAWNYLIDLGLSLVDVQQYEGFERVTRSLARSAGTRHHVCLAADFHERRLLVALEPRMAGSNCLNDMEVRFDGQTFHIELKEISTLTTATAMAARVWREIRTKAQEVPNGFGLPLVLHFVVLGYAEAMVAAETDLVEAVLSIEDLPASVSAIVVGSRMVSFDGGRPNNLIKWVRINERANQRCSELQIRKLFASKRPEPRTPSFALLSSVQFESRPQPAIDGDQGGRC